MLLHPEEHPGKGALLWIGRSTKKGYKDLFALASSELNLILKLKMRILYTAKAEGKA